MRYHYKHPENWKVSRAVRYEMMDHPICHACTLYLIDGKGIGLIQQEYNVLDKSTHWGDIDEYLIDDIFGQPGFMDYFNRFATEADDNGFYPLIPVRKIMWALRMKPMRKEAWETTFDHVPV